MTDQLDDYLDTYFGYSARRLLLDRLGVVPRQVV